MIFRRRKKIDIQALKRSINKYAVVSIDEQQKDRIKQNILQYTHSHAPAEEAGFLSVIDRIRAVAAGLKPSAYFRVLLREKLITLVEFQGNRGFLLFRGLKFSRRFVALMVVFLFITTLFFNFAGHVDRVEASYSTTLRDVQGNVSVVRDNEVLPGAAGFLLRTDDVIQTEENSSATIEFLDQSISRLASNTEIKISKLFVNPLNKTETAVELVLHKGRLWARVVNLVDNLSHFQVKAENTVAIAKRKAAFDVEVPSRGKTKVSAIQNKVDLVVATDKKVMETSLVRGFTAEVKTRASVEPTIKEDSNAQPRDEWVSSNLAQDKIYIAAVKQEAQAQLGESARILPGNPFYAVKELSENTTVALTLNELGKQRKIVERAREKFAEAEVLLEKGETAQSTVLLNDFKSQIADVIDWLKNYELEHPQEALAFRTELTGFLNGYQKKLALILPIDNLYKLKQAVSQTQLLIPDDPVQITQARLAQASDKLLEAHDLLEQGNASAARSQVEAYSQAVSEVVSEMKKLPTDDKDKGKVASVILGNKAEDLKVLETIRIKTPPVGTPTGAVQIGSSSAGFFASQVGSATAQSGSTSIVAVGSGTVEGDQDELKKMISDVKTETLAKLGEAVIDAQKSKPSVEVLRKLEEIKKIDMNGKPLVDVTLMRNKVLLKSDKEIISVTNGTSTRRRFSAPSEGTSTRGSIEQITLPTAN